MDLLGTSKDQMRISALGSARARHQPRCKSNAGIVLDSEDVLNRKEGQHLAIARARPEGRARLLRSPASLIRARQRSAENLGLLCRASGLYNSGRNEHG